MKQFNHFFYGFIPGLIIPVLFMWFYVDQFFPGGTDFIELVVKLFPSELLGKMLLLGIMPNLGFVFVLYKTESYKMAAGLLVAALPYFIACFSMM